MRIVTLMENTAQDPNLTAEHGLSLYIQLEDLRILFDAGGSAAFAENAERLGVDLRRVDAAVLSHGHSDHSGGLSRFLELNDHAPVYVSRFAFDGHYNAEGMDIGPDPALAESGRVRYVEAPTELAPGVMLVCPKGPVGPYPLDTAGLQMGGQMGLVPEDFRHEQYLTVCRDGKKILFSGCSHRGILNIAEHYRPDALIGGFHFMKREPESLAPEAEALLALPTQYYTGHCTGLAQYEFLKARMGSRLEYLSTGTELIL